MEVFCRRVSNCKDYHYTLQDMSLYPYPYYPRRKFQFILHMRNTISTESPNPPSSLRSIRKPFSKSFVLLQGFLMLFSPYPVTLQQPYIIDQKDEIFHPRWLKGMKFLTIKKLMYKSYSKKFCFLLIILIWKLL